MSGMIRRLRWKIVGISMLFVTLVLAAVFTGVMLTAHSSLEQSSTRQLEEALRGEGYDGQNGQPCFVTEVYPSGTVRVMGSSYYQISEEDLLALVQECLSQQEESGLLTDYHLRYLRYDGALSIRIAFTDSTLEQSALRAMAGNLLLIALAALVVLLGCSYLLSGVAARPVERAWQEQQRFLSDASHELRTPIAVIQGYANLLNRWGKDDPATRQEAIDAIRQEADSMKELVEQLLFLARGDNDSMHIEMETFDLTEVAAEVLKETGMIDQTHTFSARWEGAVPVCADVGLTKQALRILVDNSIKYTPAGGHITLSAALRDGMARLSVQDEGQGIDAGSLPHVFDRFYRTDQSRARQTGGTGLGLAIAKWIVDRHGGWFEVVSRVDVGTRITFLIPLKEDKPGSASTEG